MLTHNKGSLSEEELGALKLGLNEHPLLLSCPPEVNIETNGVLNQNKCVKISVRRHLQKEYGGVGGGSEVSAQV